MKSKLRKFYYEPFKFIDNLHLLFKGNEFNIFLKYERLQWSALFIAGIAMIAWVLFGFDSTPLQFIHALYEGIPPLLMGQATISDVVGIYNGYYGKEMHYSAFVIYGLEYFWLSIQFQHYGIRKSKNVAYSAAIMFLSIATFEWFWIFGFANFQGQAWVASWRWPQLRILMQNLAFTACGVLGVLYMWLDSWKICEKCGDIMGRVYRFRWNWISVLLIGATVATAVFWINYPFYREPLSVVLETGETWHNSQLFPQTLYTVDLNPTDKINAGVWFWVENDLIHGLNTLVKVIWTLSFTYIGSIGLGSLKKCIYTCSKKRKPS